MNSKCFLNLSDTDKALLWFKFLHEDALLSELEYYQEKVNAIGRADTALDIAVLTIYKKHIKNIEHLLKNMFEIEQTELM